MVTDRLSNEIIDKILEIDKNGNLSINESYFIEYKKSFQIDSQIFITMNGLANNNGGYIICGVIDQTHEPIGVNEKSLENYKNIDNEKFRGRLYSICQPNIDYQHKLVEKYDKKFIIIYIEKSENKPHIFLNADGDIKPGDIYYRYNDSCKKIQYAELEEIIEYKRIREQEKWMNFLSKIAKVGVDNLIMLDTKNGKVISPDNNMIMVDSSVVEKMNYIREGKFVETNGAPTIKLIATVLEDSNKSGKAILAKDIFLDFLLQEKIIQSREYIKQICEMQGKFPIFYYIKLAKFRNKDDVIKFIRDIDTSKPATKQALIDRITGKKFEAKITINPEGRFDEVTEAVKRNRKIKKQILQNDFAKYQTEKEIEEMCKAIRTLNKDELLKIKDNLFEKLTSIVKARFVNDDIKTVPSCIKNAIWFIDQELFFDNMFQE